MGALNSKVFIMGFTGALVVNPVLSGSVNDQKLRPNIVTITCHDLGQHLGCYGVPSVNSPNIDRLASKGIFFKNFYSTSAVSSPGRASLATGRYPQSNGLMGLTHAPWWWSINDNEKHIAQILGEKGYYTTLIGFQHIAVPERLGFKEHLSEKNNAKETVKETVEFFQNRINEKQPFYLEIGFTEVHDPYKHEADSSKGIFVPGYLESTREIRRQLAMFQGDIKFLDNCIGEILNSIEKSPIADNTVIIFISDHGIGFPGAKWSLRKAGISVPLIIYQPKSVFSGGKMFDQPMSNVDVLPTFLEYAGIMIPENVEGVSFMKLIAGKEGISPRSSVFAQYTSDMKRDNQSRTIISGKYQMIWYFDAGRSVKYPTATSPSGFAAHIEREETTGTRPFFDLFDIENDPWELVNLGEEGKYNDLIEKLAGEMMEWMRSVDDPLLRGPLATPYYERSVKELLFRTR